jgi:Ca2+-binding RTX toxin-like protein
MRHHRGCVALATWMLLSLAAGSAQAGMVEAGTGGDSSAHLAFVFRDDRYLGQDANGFPIYKALNEPNNLTVNTSDPSVSVATFQDNRTITARDNEYGNPHDCVASGWRAVCQDPQSADMQEVIVWLEGAGDRATASGSGNVELIGGDGNDTLINQGTPVAYLEGDAGDDYLQGGPGEDHISDDFRNVVPGNDVIKAGDGNDTISDSEGSDRIDAGAGDDLVLINGSATPAALSCGAGDDYLQLPAGSTIVPPLDCERVYYSG